MEEELEKFHNCRKIPRERETIFVQFRDGSGPLHDLECTAVMFLI